MENNKKVRGSGTDYGSIFVGALNRFSKIENLIDIYISGNKDDFSVGVRKLKNEEIPLLLRDARNKYGIELYYEVKKISDNNTK